MARHPASDAATRPRSTCRCTRSSPGTRTTCTSTRGCSAGHPQSRSAPWERLENHIDPAAPRAHSGDRPCRVLQWRTPRRVRSGTTSCSTCGDFMAGLGSGDEPTSGSAPRWPWHRRSIRLIFESTGQQSPPARDATSTTAGWTCANLSGRADLLPLARDVPRAAAWRTSRTGIDTHPRVDSGRSRSARSQSVARPIEEMYECGILGPRRSSPTPCGSTIAKVEVARSDRHGDDASPVLDMKLSSGAVGVLVTTGGAGVGRPRTDGEKENNNLDMPRR